MAFTEFYCQTTGSNLNAGSTTDDAAIYTATNGGWSSGDKPYYRDRGQQRQSFRRDA